MKKSVFVVLLLFCGAITYAQNFQKRKISVLPASNLTIIGDSNIAKFQCEFDTSYLEDAQVIHFSRNGSQIKFTGAVLSLNNRGFDCGSKGINRDFHDLLKSKEYPKILLELSKVALSSDTKGLATVCITIAGKQKYFDVPVAVKNGETAQVKGNLKLNIKDYNLEPPQKLFGMIVVKDDIEINFDLLIKN